MKKRKTICCTLAFLMSCLLFSCDENNEKVKEAWELEVEQLKVAMEKYKDFDAAINDGYEVDVTGYRTQMGHHYLNADLLDEKFDLEKPEVLLYAPDENGEMQFVAVEYGMPVSDINNPPPAPEGFTGSQDDWEVNAEFSLWTLHVWIILDNPDGIFTARNPTLD